MKIKSQNNKTILHLVYSMGSGGVEVVAESLASDQIKRGSKVIIACIYDQGIRTEEIRQRGIELEALNLVRGKLVWTLPKKLRELINQYNVDTLFLHVVNIDMQVILATLGTSVKKTIQIIHSVTRYSGLRKLRSIINAKLGGLFYDHVVAVSNAVYEQQIHHLHRSANSLIVIQNGVNTNKFYPQMLNLEQKKSILKEPNLTYETKTIGMGAQLKDFKDIPTFVKAAKIISENYTNNVVFFLAGTGPLKEEIEELIKEYDLDSKFKLLGRIERMPEFLNSLDLIVLSSKIEGLPLVLIEGMATGLPVVATDSIGVRDCVKPEKNGFIVPVSDSSMLATKIVDLLRDDDLRKRMGEASLKMVKEKFSLDRVKKSYWELVLS